MRFAAKQAFSRRAVLLGGAACGAFAAGALAARRFDLAGKLFNPFAADRFDLPAVPGLFDAAGAPVPGLAAADLAGRPAFLNVFASWCPQCRAEHGALLDFARSGATIYGVAAFDDADATASFLRAFGNPFARVGLDRKGWLLRALGARGVPASFVLAPAPRLVFRHFGPITPAELRAEIPRALASSGGA
jgi:thiol-disulfide isomerase/thioredoxin